MTDHADTVREALRRAVTNDPWGTDHAGYRDALTAALAALDALVAERDEAKEQFWQQRHEWAAATGKNQKIIDGLLVRADATEARVAELEKALRGLLDDDELCRYPPDGDDCFCSACRRIREARAALAGEGGDRDS